MTSDLDGSLSIMLFTSLAYRPVTALFGPHTMQYQLQCQDVVIPASTARPGITTTEQLDNLDPDGSVTTQSLTRVTITRHTSRDRVIGLRAAAYMRRWAGGQHRYARVREVRGGLSRLTAVCESGRSCRGKSSHHS